MTRSSGFVFQWQRELLGSTLPASVKFIGMTLATYGNSDGTRVKPGVERLARDTSYGTATVKRGLAALREYGWIEKVAQPRHGTRGARATEYRLEVGLPLFGAAHHGITSDPMMSSDQGIVGDPMIDRSRDHCVPIKGSLSSDQGITHDPLPTHDQPMTTTHLPASSQERVSARKTESDDQPMEPTPLNGKPNPFGVTRVDPATEEEILKARAALRRKRVSPAPARKPKDAEERAARLAEVRAALDATTADAVTVEQHPATEEDEHDD